MDNIKVSIRNLYKIFGHDPASVLELAQNGVGKQELLEQHMHVLGLKDINVDIPEGGITVIMGLSGSGKSTLIRHLNRLIDPTAGEVLVDGEDVLKFSENRLRDMRQRTMSMVFQKFALLPHRTVIENAATALKIRGEDSERQRAEAAKWLDRVGLSGFENSFPHQLSGGMQQRVGLARALTSNAEIMLMDEAFSALDPLIRTSMQDLLLELQRDLHKTIIFITHDLDEALKLADRLVILKDGYIVQQGEPQEIMLNPTDPYIEDFVSDINRARVIKVRSVMTADDGGAVDGQVSASDTLEGVIAQAQGAMDKTYRVMDGGAPVGRIDMQTLLKALVRRDASGETGKL